MNSAFNVKLCFLNCRGINRCQPDLQQYCTSYDIDLFFAAETFLKPFSGPAFTDTIFDLRNLPPKKGTRALGGLAGGCSPRVKSECFLVAYDPDSR